MRFAHVWPSAMRDFTSCFDACDTVSDIVAKLPSFDPYPKTLAHVLYSIGEGFERLPIIVGS